MYLLDTNVVSELRKVVGRRADPNVAAWQATVNPVSMFVSVIVIQELELGVLLIEARDPTQGKVLRAWFEMHVLPVFEERTLVVDTAVARECARLHAKAPRPVRDSLIAATALVHGLTVVTRNVKDFTPTGVRVLDPWIPAT
jgi:predicted nucleic acid-binding protein